MDKVRVITRSLQCRRFGWCSLIPVIGPLCSVAALIYAVAITRETGSNWNPARKEMRVGVVVAILGGLLWLAVDVFIACWLVYEGLPEF